jgi:hypothetical protein
MEAKKMKKKYVLGSVLVTLLMLVSSIAVVNTVISDPTQHTGDAYAGDVWISELDVSSEINEFDYLGIGHAKAEDDWVRWTDGSGNITANWTVDIDSRDHPEYCVLFTLAAYDIEDDNKQMANDTKMKTYAADTTYDESGTLSISLSYDAEFRETNDEATVVCYLSACIKINDTEEAVNFTSWGQDRCTIGVSFDSSQAEEPFTRFRNESNSEFPNIWSYLPGWNESSRFDDEADMLETQTFFRTSNSEQTLSSTNWDIGNFDIYLRAWGGLSGTSFIQENKSINDQWDDEDKLDLNTYADIHYTRDGAFMPAVMCRYALIPEGQGSIFDRIYKSEIGYHPDDEIGVAFTIPKSDDMIPTDVLDLGGWAWVVRPQGQYMKLFAVSDKYTINIVSGTGSSETLNSENGFYWEDSCAYFNKTFSLSVSNSKSLGITTVSVDISDMLDDNDECVYTYAGEVGDERIQITV